MKLKHGGFLLVLAILSGIAGWGGAWAHGGATGIVKERMDAMSAISRSMKAVGQMLKGEAPYDGVQVKSAGQSIAGHAGSAMTQLFPEGSLQSPTEATPAIWQDWAAFSKLADELESSALALVDLANAGADRRTVAFAFGEMTQTCKQCHESFRIKK